MAVTVAASPVPILQFFNNAGQPNVGGSILTQVGGVNAATYQDSAGTIPLANPIPLNSRGEVSDATGHSQQLFLPINTVYTFTIFDKAGNQIDQAQYVNSIQLSLSPSTIGPIIYPPSLAEINAGLTIPVALQIYIYGDLRRYGGTGGPAGSIPAADDSVAYLSACKAGYVLVPLEMAFKVVTGAGSAISPIANQVIIQGFGDNSELYCDTTGTLLATSNYLLYCSGAGSLVRDVSIKNITAPLKWQRRVETSVFTTATLTAGSAVIVVGSGTGIAIGQQVFGYGLPTGAVVTAVSGTSITLSDVVPAGLTTPTLGTYQFFGITFNTGAGLLATLAATNAAGFISPSNNDTEWASLTTLQQQQAWVGPVIYLSGDNTLIENVKGQNLSTQQSGNNVRALFNRFQGGWNWGSIAFLNMQVNPVEYDCYAYGNKISDHAYGGIVAMGYDGVTYIGNSARGVGETGFKIFPWPNVAGNTPGSVGCKRIISQGNTSVAGFQGNFDYNAPFLPTATAGLSQCVSIGDYASWSPFGGLGYQGSGWIIDAVAEMNAGPALLAQIDHSRISVKAMENTYANLNTGVSNTVAISGAKNLGDGIIVYNKTARTRTGIGLTFIGGATRATSSSLVNSSTTDAVTADAVTLQLSGCVDIHNLTGNGPLSACEIGAQWPVTLTPAATVAIDMSQGRRFEMFLGSAIAVEFLNPTVPPLGRYTFTIAIQNASGSSFTPTFDTLYKVTAGGISAQANATVRNYEFQWNGVHLSMLSNSGDVAP